MLATSTPGTSLLAYSALLALVSSVQAALTVNTPTVWTLDEPSLVTWTSDDTADPATIGVHLVNADGSVMYEIDDQVATCEGSLIVILDGVPAGDGYVLGLISDPTTMTVISASAPFSIIAGGATSGNATVSSAVPSAVVPSAGVPILAGNATSVLGGQPTAANRTKHHGHTAKHLSGFKTSTRSSAASATVVASAISDSAVVSSATDVASSVLDSVTAIPTVTESASVVTDVVSASEPVVTVSPISDILPAPSTAASSAAVVVTSASSDPVVTSAASSAAAVATSATATATAVSNADIPAATQMCDSFDELTVGDYTIFQNNWGAASATSGSQCTNYTGVNADGSIAWDASWTWVGGQGQVKSYANVALEAVDKAISDITSIPTVWKWTYTGTGVDSMVSDVSYDLWLAPTAAADNDYEIMVWLAAYGGAGPISATGSPVATPEIAGTTWNLFSGANGPTTVFSFVAPAPIMDFSADLLDFFNYLVTSQGVDASQVVTSIQAGLEPFSGTDVVLETSSYSASVV